ncbi:MAG: HEAT repeat domain-containing protein [Blastocatellia bacterium]|nr:HEAT repeat domain-containing protein [Blastocatellia bacterium]
MRNWCGWLVLLLVPMVGWGQNPQNKQGDTPFQILTSATYEKNPDKRREAIVAVSLMGAQDEALHLLEAALRDEDVPVRVAACASLPMLKDPKVIPLLKKALDDTVPEVSFAAAKALWEMNDPAGRDVLLEVVEGDKKVKSGFLTSQKRDALRLMKTPNGMFKLVVREGIGFIPLPGVGTGYASLESLMAYNGISGRAAAALLLAQDKGDDSLQVLVEALDDKDWTVRASAVHALALRNEPKVKQNLVPLLDDKKDAVRYRAAAAIIRLEWLAKNRGGNRKRP